MNQEDETQTLKQFEVTIHLWSDYKVIVNAEDKIQAGELAEEYAHYNYSYNGDCEAELIVERKGTKLGPNDEAEVVEAEVMEEVEVEKGK